MRRKNNIRIASTDFTNYQLGILYSIGSLADESNAFVVRHKNKYFVKQLQEVFNVAIYKQKQHDNMQYILKSCILDMNTFENWNDRKADVRGIPKLETYNDFLRSYIEIHGCWNYCTNYTRKKEKYYRLRFSLYGNINIMKQINDILHTEAKVNRKSIQLVSNNKTAYISFTSFPELQQIVNYVAGCPCNVEYWENVKQLLDNPKKYKL